MNSKEMSAIIICGGAPNPYLSHLKKIRTQYHKTVMIGVDAGALALINAGYKLDYAVGDFDSISQDEYLKIKHETKELKADPSEQDETDLAMALLLIQQLAIQGDIYIYGALGTTSYGRLDHLLSNIWTVHQKRFRSLMPYIQFIEKNHQLAFYFPGQYQFDNPQHATYFSPISLTPVKKLEIKNAKYELEATDFDYPIALISNEFKDNQTIQLSFEEGIIMVLYVKEVK